jgi:hypothetical protein
MAETARSRCSANRSRLATTATKPVRASCQATSRAISCRRLSNIPRFVWSGCFVPLPPVLVPGLRTWWGRIDRSGRFGWRPGGTSHRPQHQPPTPATDPSHRPQPQHQPQHQPPTPAPATYPSTSHRPQPPTPAPTPTPTPAPATNPSPSPSPSTNPNITRLASEEVRVARSVDPHPPGTTARSRRASTWEIKRCSQSDGSAWEAASST